MASAKSLLSAIESALLGPSPPSPHEKIELLNAIHASLPSFRSILSYPAPKASDREQVLTREIRPPDSSPIRLDDLDVQVALKLSDDLNLNEIDCVLLLVAANNKWGLSGREPLEIFRLAAGLWYTERKDMITALGLLLRVVVLDQGTEPDIVADICSNLETLFSSGLRQHIINLIKELNREEATGLGGPLSEPFLLDSKGNLVERRAVVWRELLNLCHCLLLSVLIVHMDPKDVLDVFSLLKEHASSASTLPTKIQITIGLLFCLMITFISDALGIESDKASVLSQDITFLNEFRDLVMISNNDAHTEGFVSGVRLSWIVNLMATGFGGSARDLEHIKSCLDLLSSKNVFQFLLDRVLHTAAYKTDDEDMIYIYNAYLHKLMMCFLCQPLAFDMVKKMLEDAANIVSLDHSVRLQDSGNNSGSSSQEGIQFGAKPYLSLMELLGEIYQKEPELLNGNEDMWSFVHFAGEEHRNIQTLVAFLKMLSSLASSEDGASRVFELLQGKAFRTIAWRTLFDCLSTYEQRFRQYVGGPERVLPELPESDARALVAYLNTLEKVVANGNAVQRKKWFPDIEPLFKLLAFENVPPYLKGALRSAIAAFVQVCPIMRNMIWTFLEQYDLPVVGFNVENAAHVSGQVYDIRFELNEVEARVERYPSTISFIKLINKLVAEEQDTSDKGYRLWGIFRFIYDHVFVPFPQRAFADPLEKWTLVVSCLDFFKLILEIYDIHDEDVENTIGEYEHPIVERSSSVRPPTIELLMDFMSGRHAYRNIINLLSVGVDAVIHDRSVQTYGFLLEKAVELSLKILVLVFDNDAKVVDSWRPLFQPLDAVLSHDPNQVVTILAYVRYEFNPSIQICAIKIMRILSSRMIGLVQLLLKFGAANSLIKDYAACLEMRADVCEFILDTINDAGYLILQVLIENISRAAPNVTHLLLSFNVDAPVEQSVLQPLYHFSCLTIILEILEKVAKPDVNALLHELGLQLLYELCIDPSASPPTMDLLSSKKYTFFLMHLNTIGVAPLPKRNNDQQLRISSLHQRSWLLKLLALPLHVADANGPFYPGACKEILCCLFGPRARELAGDAELFHKLSAHAGYSLDDGRKIKVIELLNIVQFRPPEAVKTCEEIGSKYGAKIVAIVQDPSASNKGGIYFYSERGDRLIDLAALKEKVLKLCSNLAENDMDDLRGTIQQLLRWSWRYNKNLEEQAAQLHMLTGWSHVVEVAVSRGMEFFDNRTQILFWILDASLSSSASVDCSLNMAMILTRVALTCLAKLREESYVFSGDVNSDTFTWLDMIMMKQLPNAACSSLLIKLVMSLLRHETSEALRRCQYALMLGYFQYCQSIINPDIPTSVLHYLLQSGQYEVDISDVEKTNREQSELVKLNFDIVKKEAQSILDMIIKDAVHGSQMGKFMAFYLLSALVSLDCDRFFLNQLQSRGFLRSCFTSLNRVLYQGDRLSSDFLQHLYTYESKLALLLKICHNYGKVGAQVLFSMGVLEQLSSCRIEGVFPRADIPRIGHFSHVHIDRKQLIILPTLRLVSCLSSLVDTSDFLEMKNKVVRDTADFAKHHQMLFCEILKEDISQCDEHILEQVTLVVSILYKVWPYEKYDEYGLIQGVFGLMRSLFSLDMTSLDSARFQEDMELAFFRLCFSLSSYLYFLVSRKSLRLLASDGVSSYEASKRDLPPSLLAIVDLLRNIGNTLQRASDERLVLLNKIEGINDLSKSEIDEIISLYGEEACMSSQNTRRRRHAAMFEMCKTAGKRDLLITLLLHIVEHLLNIFLMHFQDRDSSRVTGYGTAPEFKDDTFCEKLLPNLETIEQLSEAKTGHSLKVLRRLVSTIKESVSGILV